MVLWYVGTVVLLYAGMGCREVSTNVPSEFTCIRIQIQGRCMLQKMHPYSTFNV